MNNRSIYGLRVSGLIEELPSDVKEVSVRLDSSTQVNDELIDKIIELRLGGVEVIIEIPGNVKIPDYQAAINLSQNAAFDISMLPPSSMDKKHMLNYVEQFEQLAKLALGNPNYTRKIYPFQSVLEILFSDAVDGGDRDHFTDRYGLYMESNFNIPAELILKLKSAARASFGGEAAFSQVASALFLGIKKKAQGLVKGVA